MASKASKFRETGMLSDELAEARKRQSLGQSLTPAQVKLLQDVGCFQSAVAEAGVEAARAAEREKLKARSRAQTLQGVVQEPYGMANAEQGKPLDAGGVLKAIEGLTKEWRRAAGLAAGKRTKYHDDVVYYSGWLENLYLDFSDWARSAKPTIGGKEEVK